MLKGMLSNTLVAALVILLASVGQGSCSQVSNFTSAPIGALELWNLPAFSGKYERPTDRPSNNRPTNQQTELRVHREVTLPVMQ